jgi:hypothetical protein
MDPVFLTLDEVTEIHAQQQALVKVFSSHSRSPS